MKCNLCWNSLMLLGMLSLSGTHAAYPVIVQTKASDMRSGSIRSAGGKWKPGSDPVCSGDGLFIVQINPRICARDQCSAGKNIGFAEARMAEAMAEAEVYLVTLVFLLLAR